MDNHCNFYTYDNWFTLYKLNANYLWITRYNTKWMENIFKNHNFNKLDTIAYTNVNFL